jgi:hypothetical protein
MKKKKLTYIMGIWRVYNEHLLTRTYWLRHLCACVCVRVRVCVCVFFFNPHVTTTELQEGTVFFVV